MDIGETWFQSFALVNCWLHATAPHALWRNAFWWVVNGCEWLSMVMNGCEWLWTVVNGDVTSQQFSYYRIGVEHLIGHMKRFNILGTRYRGRLDRDESSLVDALTVIASILSIRITMRPLRHHVPFVTVDELLSDGDDPSDWSDGDDNTVFTRRRRDHRDWRPGVEAKMNQHPTEWTTSSWWWGLVLSMDIWEEANGPHLSPHPIICPHLSCWWIDILVFICCVYSFYFGCFCYGVTTHHSIITSLHLFTVF